MDNQESTTPEVQSPIPAASIPPEQPLKPNSRNWKKWVLIGTVSVLVIIGGGIFVLSQQKSQTSKTKTATQPTVIQLSPTPYPTADWKTYTNPSKGYTLKYPPNWIIKDESEYLNTAQFSTADKTVYIIISEGQYPYESIVQKEISENDLNIAVSDKTYKVKERIVNNSGAYVDFALNNLNNHHIYFGTGDLGGGAGKGLSEYNKEKVNILKILQTIKFTDQESAEGSTKYLNIRDWKVRMSISDTLSGLKIADEESAFAPTDKAVKVLAPMLNSGWLCSGDTEASIGSISRTTNAVRSGSYAPLATKRIGEFTYGYEATPTSNCTSDPKYQELVKEFTAAFNSLENY